MRNWVIALSPNGRGWLTKFGLWMLRLKEFLDFPVYATAVWLMYVLTQEASAAGSTAALAGLVLIAFAAWLYGAVGLSEGQWRRFGVGLSTVAVMCGAFAVLPLVGGGACNVVSPPPGVKLQCRTRT